MAEPNPQDDFAKLSSDFAALREDVAKLTESLAAVARQEATGAAETVKRKVRAGSARAEATATGLLEEGAAAVEDARACASTMARDVCRTVERNPIASVTAALGVGFLFGLLSRGR